jgi:hypothetical protein
MTTGWPGSRNVRAIALAAQRAEGGNSGGHGFDDVGLCAIVPPLPLCRIRLVDQDTSLSRRRSGVRIPHAVPRFRKDEMASPERLASLVSCQPLLQAIPVCGSCPAAIAPLVGI